MLLGLAGPGRAYFGADKAEGRLLGSARWLECFGLAILNTSAIALVLPLRGCTVAAIIPNISTTGFSSGSSSLTSLN